MDKDYFLSKKGFIYHEDIEKLVKLMNDNVNRVKENGKTDLHHIIPQCWFKNMNFPVDNSKTNTINLLYKDHLQAHIYLYNCTEGELKSQMALCIIYMLREKKLDATMFDLENYQKVREEASKKVSERNYKYWSIPENKNKLRERNKGNKVWLGRHHTEETKKKMSEIMKGKNTWCWGRRANEFTKKAWEDIDYIKSCELSSMKLAKIYKVSKRTILNIKHYGEK